MAKSKLDEYRFKVITDPVHGDIGLSRLEVDLINTQSFQRLRRLKQLGLATLVYPSASHSRFSHSLGVFHIMSRAIELMVRRGKFTDTEGRLLRIAALLHDIGHYPYSHLVERLDRDPYRKALLGRGRRGKPARSYPDHEKLSAMIVTGRKDIAGILNGAGIDPADIASIIQGQHRKRRYNQLIHSTLDLDRMDYLVRDAIATGVPFGRIDLNYLLSNLDLDGDDTLVLHAKAETAVEHFIVARYFMSKAVYFHKTVFAFEALMRQTLFLLREQGELWKSGNDIEKLVKHPTEFLTFHDGRIDSIVEKQADTQPKSSALGRLCRALRDRKPPKLIFGVSSLARGGARSEEHSRFLTRRQDQLESVATKCGIPIECWLWEDPKDVAFEKLGPLMSMSEAASVSPQASAELVRLLDKKGKTVLLMEKPSSILHHLSGLKLQTARLYVVEENEAKVAKAERAVKAWLKQ
ncbi:MAG: HD domain-containing protein [Planctomycetota bacterium]